MHPESVERIDLSGRVAIVTGAGSGLGRSHAVSLAARGAAVVVNDIGEDSGTKRADAVVDEILAAGGAAAASYASVTESEAAASLTEDALRHFGRLDVLINNAGTLISGSAASFDLRDVEALLRVHLVGAFQVTQPAYRHMRNAGFGRIVFTSSNAGLLGLPGCSGYGAAKMGLVGLSQVLALEGARHGVTSNVIAPVAATRMAGEQHLGPLAEVLDPVQVSPLVTYLASERCHTTGEIFSAGGGRYARVAVAMGAGWFAGLRSRPSAEQVEINFDAIRDLSEAWYPASANEELEHLAHLLGSSPPTNKGLRST